MLPPPGAVHVLEEFLSWEILAFPDDLR